jgi:SPP1 family predicted phage head-tail adaptor
MSGVAAGKLRHWIELQRNNETQNPDTGEPIPNWTTYAEVWADIAPSSGREFVAAAAEQSEVRGKITIRYRDDVNAKDRVLYRGKWYNILAVLDDNDSMLEHQTLMIAEGVRLDQ